MGFIGRKISKNRISAIADKGPLPGKLTAKGNGVADLHEILEKEYFALEVPKPSQAHINSLPPIETVVDELFMRTGPAPKSRVSLMLPFIAQHLTDAIFQSGKDYRTDASHEIILNQVYGNTPSDEKSLRSGIGGKLKTQSYTVGGKQAEFPDALCTKVGGEWVIKTEYEDLSYLTDEKRTKLLAAYKGREGELCAVGLFQGNMTVGNFALTALLVREHNRLCDGIAAELGDASDGTIFRLARQNNIVAYMKIVIEDYINTFAGIKIFELDTKSFFHSAKRWCRETPIPYHFNILYRIHSLIPDTLKIGDKDLGFKGFLSNNGEVMKAGLGPVFESASNQAASDISLGNTHKALRHVEMESVAKARGVLGSFNAHREVQKQGSSLKFKDFDPRYREKLKELYGDVDKVEYLVGVFAEQPKRGLIEKLGIKSNPIMGSTLMDAIAKHAFRHILGNRYMTREFLNEKAMTKFGWKSLKNTSSASDLVKRNVPEMGAQAKDLRISLDAPK